mgnify:CR=1 FL=1
MKLTLKFQTLILLTLTVVLSVATAVWGAIVYYATYDIILHGFDQKLTALSVGAGEFTDGDGHASYQRPRQIRALIGRPDATPVLPTIACPTLVAVGEADLLTPPEQSAEIAAAIPGATLHRLPGAGHLLTMEQPAAVAALLLDWLRAFEP